MNSRIELRKSKKIVVLCEGDSEENAINYFIKKQWEADFLDEVGLHTVNLRGHFEKVASKANLYLLDQKVIAVFTLIDLHEFKRVRLPHSRSLNERATAARQWLSNGVKNNLKSRFHPHLSVYEVEAWILAEGIALQSRLRNKSIKPESNAEEKNDQDPPKNRLNKIFHSNGRKPGFQEIIDGRYLFSKLEFQRVYSSCPYFHAFYDDLKDIAQRALSR